MRILGAAAVFIFFGLIIWFECQRSADRIHVCRGLGHGAMYCFLSEVAN
jgi:hypothetical protein